MTVPAIHFGTSGWRAIIADEFTFANVRLAVSAIAGHVASLASEPAALVACDPRFLSEDYSRLAADVLSQQGVKVFLCDTFAPTPAVAFEVLRRKLTGAINFTASHNLAPYHGLKFNSADGGPALPEVTKDIEARIGRLAARGDRPAARRGKAGKPGNIEVISIRKPYLERLNALVKFDKIRDSKFKFICDAVHGCGAGYLDESLRLHGAAVTELRANRDVLFDGGGPDVIEENLVPLRRTVLDSGAAAGLATDGDADRFGIIDRDGAWISPNHILALLYDYLVETRGWNMPAARSVATSHMLDAVARSHGQTVYQTPVGFKYVGDLIKQDKIALGGEESAGLSIRGHVPEKDGILACLLVAEMIAHRKQTLGEQIQSLFGRIGAEFWPLRQNLHLSEEVKSRAVKRLKEDYKTFLGRRVRQLDRTDGAKFIFEDGSWVLLRPSGTEPLLRVYTEASSLKASTELSREAAGWIEKEEA
ncbi:MAG: phosphoglucomutase/phosphomannomutase family protein [Candidatus Acidiferrales bacterium]|jgi:phosphoglucomutase